MLRDIRVRIEYLLVKPLWGAFLIFGITSAIQVQIFNSALFFLVAWFGMARIGAGLYPEKYGPTSDKGFDESYLVGRAVLRLAFLLAAVCAIFRYHAGGTWWRTIGVTVAVYIGTIILTVIVVAFPFRAKRRAKLHTASVETA